MNIAKIILISLILVTSCKSKLDDKLTETIDEKITWSELDEFPSVKECNSLNDSNLIKQSHHQRQVKLLCNRIFHVINDKELFPQKIALNNDILVINFGEEYISKILNLLDELRGLEKKVFIYPRVLINGKAVTYSDDDLKAKNTRRRVS